MKKSGFQAIDPAIRANFRSDFAKKNLGKKTVKWARRVFWLWKTLPGMLDKVYAAGYENLPSVDDNACIITMTHKKIHDVGTLVGYFAGRDKKHFTDLSIVGQAGVFNGIYPYKDLTPRFLKASWIRPLITAGARLAGQFLKNFFTSLHVYPVYREGSDVPDRETYESAEFNGPGILKMNYDEFLRHSSRVTMNSIMQVQKEMVTKKRSFVILPEGIYKHEGFVAPLQDFAGLLAFRKSVKTVPVSLSYDELCPESKGSIRAFCYTGEPMDPPKDKAAVADYTVLLTDVLQRNTPATASHILAALILRLPDSFKKSQLEELFHRASKAILSIGPADPELEAAAGRKKRLSRFFSKKGAGSRWFHSEHKNDGEIILTKNHATMNKFEESERDVGDALWNANHLKHLSNLFDDLFNKG